jgi:acyl-CoA thioester hydrolase
VSGPGPTSGVFVDGVHHLTMRVYYEDTDTAGIVYYANYLRYIERARTEILRLCGVDQHFLMNGPLDDRISFAVTRCEIDYVAPAHLDDVIMVKTRTTRLRGASIHMEQDIWRGDEILIKSLVKAACLNQNGMPTRLPKNFVNRAKELLLLK